MPYHDISSGLLHLDAEITYENTVTFLATLRQMEANPDVDTIKIFITSHGGALMPAIAIAQAMSTCGKPVATLGAGYVASSALLVLAAGTRGQRSIIAGTTLLLHQPTNMLADTSKQNPHIDTWKDEVQLLEAVVQRYYWVLEQCSIRSASFWREQLGTKSKRLVSEDEAVENGLIDAVQPFDTH